MVSDEKHAISTKQFWRMVLRTLGFVTILFLICTHSFAAQAARSSDGWRTSGNRKVYYENGKRVKGWKKIKEKKYYFNRRGVLQRNKIVGSKEKGYYYVDTNGVRVTTYPIRAAVAFVMNNSKKNQTSIQRLKACFEALCTYPYYRFYNDAPSAQMIPSYATYMFKNRQGNCYRYASTFAYIARVLGFDSRVAAGAVTARGTNALLSPHGWCEVKIGTEWKMCDCSMQRAYRNHNLFLVSRSSYPFRFRCDQIFTMRAKRGKVIWK